MVVRSVLWGNCIQEDRFSGAKVILPKRIIENSGFAYEWVRVLHL